MGPRMMHLVFVAIFLVTIWVPQSTSGTEGKKMVCYFGSWATYRPGAGKFDVEAIDPMLCTHMVYGFAGLRGGEIASLDSWNERCTGYGKGAYIRFNKLKEKNPNLKTIIAIGGWNEGSTKYSEMASSSAGRKRFVDSVLSFLETFKFDGLDLDWEYPANRGGVPKDRENFVLLAKELREAFDKHGYLLTAAVSAGVPTIKTAYDIPRISKYFHFISIMAYDFHGAWDKMSGHHSPLYRHPMDTGDFEFFNVNSSVHYWIENGAPRDKLVLGMGTYGRGVTLDDPKVNGIYAPGRAPLRAGPYTREKGFWGYNEICSKLRENPEKWTVVTDPYYMAPYAYSGRDWIGYDTPESIKIKAQFAKSLGLAGGMVWSLETDDFGGKCHGERYPLIKTVYRTIVGPYPTYQWEPKPARSTSTQVCEYYRPTWVPQKYPKTTTPYAPIETGRPSHHVPNNPQHPVPTPPPTLKPLPTKPSNPIIEDVPIPSNPIDSVPDSSSQESEESNNLGSNEPSGPLPSHKICKKEGINADPNGDCSKFYICELSGSKKNKWRVYMQKCPSGTVFDPSIEACNHPRRVKGCSKQIIDGVQKYVFNRPYHIK